MQKRLLQIVTSVALHLVLWGVASATPNQNYIIDTDITIKTKDGGTVTAISVRPKNASKPLPTVMQFNIYVDESRELDRAIKAAKYGYNSIVAFPRGKRTSPDFIVPYEYETLDTHAVLDWIVKQPWSDGQVGMYGGSYSGFAAWAAAKTKHPALKTIVPYVASIPGVGLPMENNIFINANYGWGFYVTNNKTLDNEVYKDRERWNSLNDRWFESGLPYRQYDAIDGTPNPLFQKWLSHPDYDSYWQAMVPFEQEFKQIDIPVLSITGYFDDAQISALHYLREHEKYRANADHYLVIGPYDHWTSQTTSQATLRDYKLDEVARIDVSQLTFQWFDYILKDGKKPDLLKDKINFQLMADNSWQSAPSLASLNESTQRFYLTKANHQGRYRLSPHKSPNSEFIKQSVDLADRTISHNDDYYPWPIIKEDKGFDTGVSFLSATLEEDMMMAGQFSATLLAQINKRDMDVGLTLYEVMPDGKLFHLSYLLARASYSEDMTRRQLLTPGKTETLNLERSRMTGKRINKGSRLLLHLDINKNSFAQVNFGTGKNVSLESVVDGAVPLEIHWFNNSYIDIPIRPFTQE